MHLSSRLVATVGLAAALAMPCFANNDKTATAGQLQSFNDGVDCIYFTLNGVSPADPLFPLAGTGLRCHVHRLATATHTRCFWLQNWQGHPFASSLPRERSAAATQK